MSSRNKFRNALGAGILLLLLATALPLTAQQTGNPGEPIANLQFQSADIRSVLTFLADYGGINVVIAPEVKGNVTIKLHNVHWRSAMDIIARTYNMTVVDEEGGYLRVLPAEDYRKEMTEMEKHRSEQQKLVKLDTKIVSISNSTSDDIVEAVKSLMTDRGKATSDPRSNSIILQEIPENMPVILDYIAELDRPARQIKISTQLLEIYTSDLTEYGIDWDVASAMESDGGHRTSQVGGVIDATDVTDGGIEVSVTSVGQGTNIEAVVEAIVSNGKGKIIAHPEITTIDNHEAKIQMGAKIPVKQFDEAGNVVIKFEEIGTILTVTPHITADNEILMHLAPERSSYQYDANGVIINTSNAETHVIVSNGQTAVIGGLTTEDESEGSTGVPILKDIPVVGLLFKYTTKKIESRDLVIFVTPTIVDDKLALSNDSGR
ncbi:MAG TPA: secretin N-terminal domain-containing protein [candidate division Zixibacteria bacterium]|nr:secretin N-terminal domain-containing protein [candidate division Zixibacteria bacterium]